MVFCHPLPQLGSPQQKPKRLRLVVDVSGSMYRFNGVDRRLERSMEAVCMVMEAFENYEEKFKVMVPVVECHWSLRVSTGKVDADSTQSTILSAAGNMAAASPVLTVT